jgi:8-oxo-dGTP diphosphatase
MKQYVLGFAFDKYGSRVVLIKKKRPEWQAGRWNGICGHVEKDESPSIAMSREFEEETGVVLPFYEWKLRGIMFAHNEWLCSVFTYVEKIDSNILEMCRTTTDEEVRFISIDIIRLARHRFIENISALIELCKMEPEPPSNKNPYFTLDYTP